jgi:elongation factor G
MLELIDELLATSAPQFSVEPTRTLDFETIRSSTNDVEGKHEVDHQQARVVIDLFTLPEEDEEEDKGDLELRFVNDAKDSIPADFVPACENAFREACKAGPLKGFPVTRIGMRLRRGSQRGESVLASHFSQATAAALKTAFSKGEFALLEPFVYLDIRVPCNFESTVFDVLDKIGGKVGSVMSVNDTGLNQVTGQCPASKYLDFRTRLSGETYATATVSMEFGGFQYAPTR